MSDHLSQLSEDSNSYAYVEYFLRLSLQATTARITSSWEVSNPQLTLQFEKRSKEVLTVDSWIDVSSLCGPNTEDEILKRGFHFDQNCGFKFSVGKIQLLSNGQEQGKIVKRFLLCKVAIGRAYNAGEEYAAIAALPEGYDSFFLDRDKIQVAEDVLISDQQQSYEYVVKDPAQILPTFIVSLEYDPEAEQRSRQKVLCENCDSAPATYYCQADSANLCDRCDQQLHSSKLSTRHVRIPLDAGPQSFSHCRTHPDKAVEFFCPSCSKPVCVHCKMVGHHASGDASKHKLITVAEAFKSVSESAAAADPLLAARKAQIRAQIGAVSERAKQVELNSNEIQEQLEALFQKTLSDLKSITKKKLNVLKGDTIELHRQLSEIGQLEHFLQYQQSGGNATQFILDWSHCQRLKSQQHSFGYFRNGIDVLPDIKINGSIQVHVDQTGGSYPVMSRQPTELGDPLLAAARQSIMGEGKPRYSPTRPRALPTVGGNGEKSRRPTDFLAETLQSMTSGMTTSKADVKYDE